MSGGGRSYSSRLNDGYISEKGPRRECQHVPESKQEKKMGKNVVLSKVSMH